VSHPLTAYTILLCLSLSLSFLDTPSSSSTHTFTHMHVHTCHLYCMSVFCSIQNTLPVHLVHLSTFTQAHTHTHLNSTLSPPDLMVHHYGRLPRQSLSLHGM